MSGPEQPTGCPVLPELETSQPAEAATVFIVDDDPAVRSALSMLVLSCGWQPRTFSNGVEFLAERGDIGTRRACLILDLNMPDMDGEEVLTRLRRQGSALPVVIISAESRPGGCERLLKLGANRVLGKPFQDEVFHDAVSDCLDLAG